MTHTHSNSSPAQLLSAMVDGELNAPVTQQDLEQPALYAQWNQYQIIGEVLRSSGKATGTQTYGADPAFLHRLSHKLANEQIEQIENIENIKTHGLLSPVAGIDVVARPDAAASNDPAFRWKLVAGLASFGMAAVVAFNVGGLPWSTSQPLLAQGGAVTERVVASPLGPMVRDARFEELLAAHKQLGGTSLQAPSGFLRNAGFESAPGSQR